MEKKGETMCVRDKIAVLSFDEMSIGGEWSYDKGKDILYKPHEKVQVAMLRGLFGNWRQPIYYDFDMPDHQDVIPNLIREVEGAGYPIVDITS